MRRFMSSVSSRMGRKDHDVVRIRQITTSCSFTRENAFIQAHIGTLKAKGGL